MQMVRSRWCNERPMTSSWDCQVRFLPLIVPTQSNRQQADNVLTCVDSKDTFLMNCPRLRDDGTELSDECNHLKTNSRGCDKGNYKCSAQKPTNQVRQKLENLWLKLYDLNWIRAQGLERVKKGEVSCIKNLKIQK